MTRSEKRKLALRLLTELSEDDAESVLYDYEDHLNSLIQGPPEPPLTEEQANAKLWALREFHRDGGEWIEGAAGHECSTHGLVS